MSIECCASGVAGACTATSTLEITRAYTSDRPELGRVDFLFSRHDHCRAMLERARVQEILGRNLRVVDASDLIGLKVQSSSNDPSCRYRDLANIEWLLRHADLEMKRVRESFRLIDREQELDALLAELERP